MQAGRMQNLAPLDFEVLPEWFMYKREQPVLSILIPTFNRLEKLKRSVASLCNQDTSIPYEIIIVSDGCTDRTLDWLEEDQNPIVRWAGVRENTRLPNRLLNRAILYLAKGELVQHFFDDDKAYPNMVACLGGVLSGCPGFHYAHAKVHHLHGQKVIKTYGGPLKLDEIARKNTMPLQGVFFRRSAFLELGGFDEDERMAPRMDWDFVVRLAVHKGFRGIYFDSVVSAWCPESSGILLSYWQGEDQDKVKELEAYRAAKWQKLGLKGAGAEYT